MDRDQIELMAGSALAAMLDEAPLLLFRAMPGEDMIALNAGWDRYTGRDRATLHGNGWHDVVDARDLEAFRDRLPRDGAHEGDVRIRRSDGIWRWHRVQARAQFDEQGRSTGWVGFALDVHDRRVAEERLRQAFDVASMASWRMDLTTGAFEHDAQMAPLFGLPPGEPVLRHASQIMDLIHTDDRVRVATAMADGIPKHGVQEVEYRVHRRDGTIGWLATRVRLEREGERLVRLVGISRDITRRRQAQEALESLNQELEARIAAAVAEREEALAKLHEAQKMETVGRLTGGVAHDFNNLLTPIVGGLDMLSRRVEGDPVARKIVAGAAQAADKARILVGRMLAFARRQTLQPQPIDPAMLIEHLRELILRSVGVGVRLVVEQTPAVHAVRVDPNQLELAILNLCVNAGDAMPNGGTLTLRVVEGAADGMIAIEVEDTGAGMDADTLRRCIEPFFTTKAGGSGQSGTGLGLSMVDGLAAQSGGRLEIDSAPGRGTRVRILLPLTEDRPVSREPDSSPPARAVRPATVLLVDDEDLVRRGAAEMLRDLGYVVVEAASGAAALDMMAAGLSPDLLVTDYLMPSMTGTVLIERMRALAPGLPALLVTGYAQGAAQLPPSLPCLPKPFRQTELAACVAALLKPASNVIEFPKAGNGTP